MQILTRQEQFQSTLPVWGATTAYSPPAAPAEISIHAPRVGSDQVSLPATIRQNHFNPRSPCGERLGLRQLINQQKLFQSTLPVWGATYDNLQIFLHGTISIHAPRVGSDGQRVLKCAKNKISIHAPRVGSCRLYNDV